MKFLKFGLFAIACSFIGTLQASGLNKKKDVLPSNLIEKSRAQAKTGCVDEDNTKFVIGCEKEIKESCAEKVHCTHIQSQNCLFITENDCYEKGCSQCKQIVIFFADNFGANGEEFPADANIVQLIPQKSLFTDSDQVPLPDDYETNAFIALKNSDGSNIDVLKTSEMEKFKANLLESYKKEQAARESEADKKASDPVHNRAVETAIKGAVNPGFLGSR